MKIKSIILSVFCVALLALCVGCGCSSSDVTEAKETVFRGIITDVQGPAIIVKPYQQYPEYEKGTVKVNASIDASKKPDKLLPGKSVEICYDGIFTDGNIPIINKTYSINYVDVKGEIIENK